jgi:hypothetical protein
MTISGINTNSNLNTPQNTQNTSFSQIRTDFNAMTSAVSSGNLTAAQKAYAALEADLGNGSAQNQNPTLAAIGKDLQSGDIKSAQSLLSGMQHAHHGHGHKGGKSGQSENLLALLFGTPSTDGTTTDTTNTTTGNGTNSTVSYSA